MDNLIRILILAVIGGFIGYVTNVVAIRLIFRPIEPIKIPILNIEIVGLIPKRRAEDIKKCRRNNSRRISFYGRNTCKYHY